MEYDPCLGNCEFSLNLPKPLASGDEITIKARVLDDAERFSINLCFDEDEPDGEPMCIAYHLGLDYSDGDCKVYQASRNYNWEVVDETVDSVFNSRMVDIILRMDDDTIKVYHEDTQHYPDYEFTPNVPVELIRTVQLRDGVASVAEIQLKFGQ